MKMFFLFVPLFLIFVVVKKVYENENFTKKFYELNIANLEKNYDLEIKMRSPLILREYIVQTGDSFWNIAKKFNIGMDTIISVNQVEKVHFIKPGEKVKIPNVNGLLFEKQGASLREMAMKYDTDFREVSFFNLKPIWENHYFLNNAKLSFAERLELLGAEFLKPLNVISISSGYGFRIHPISKKRAFHKGVDLRGVLGSKVYSARGGRVVFSGTTGGFGKVVYIKHAKGYQTIYAHLGKVLVRTGQKVGAQQVIGTLGLTGYTTGPHLHFEIRQNGKPINPLNVLDLY